MLLGLRPGSPVAMLQGHPGMLAVRGVMPKDRLILEPSCAPAPLAAHLGEWPLVRLMRRLAQPRQLTGRVSMLRRHCVHCAAITTGPA